MREIKFRYVFLEKLHKEIRMEILTLDEIEARSLRMRPMLKNEEIIARDLWTGRRDCTGADVYECDILEAKYYSAIRRYWSDTSDIPKIDAEVQEQKAKVYTVKKVVQWGRNGCWHIDNLKLADIFHQRINETDDFVMAEHVKTDNNHAYSWEEKHWDFKVIGNIHQHKHLLED